MHCDALVEYTKKTSTPQLDDFSIIVLRDHGPSPSGADVKTVAEILLQDMLFCPYSSVVVSRIELRMPPADRISSP